MCLRTRFVIQDGYYTMLFEKSDDSLVSLQYMYSLMSGIRSSAIRTRRSSEPLFDRHFTIDVGVIAIDRERRIFEFKDFKLGVVHL